MKKNRVYDSEYIDKKANMFRRKGGMKLNALIGKKGLIPAKMVDKFPTIIKSDSEISKIINGKRPISIKLLIALRLVWGVDLNDFIADAPIPQISVEMKEKILNLAEIIKKEQWFNENVLLIYGRAFLFFKTF